MYYELARQSTTDYWITQHSTIGSRDTLGIECRSKCSMMHGGCLFFRVESTLQQTPDRMGKALEPLASETAYSSKPCCNGKETIYIYIYICIHI